MPQIGPEHRPAAYWFWSRIPAAVEAKSQLWELAGAGFSTVLIQPRLSFPRELYLSDEYLWGYRQAVQIAGEVGLQVGVYDEYNWISGHGGGRTVAAAPELRERHLFWTTSSVADPLTLTLSGIHSPWIDGLGPAGQHWLYEDGHRSWDEWQTVALLAHPAGSADGRPVHGDCALVEGDADHWQLRCQPGEPLPDGWVMTAFLSGRCRSSRLINYLDPRAGKRFVEAVYEPYARALEGLLGDPVRYFAFDHPYAGFYDWDQCDGEIGNSLLWTADHSWLPESELGRLLLCAVADRSGRGRRARARLFAAYSQRGIDSFFAPLSRWAADHGVGLSGHEYLAHVGGWGLNDGFPEVDGRTNFGLDYFAIDAHRSQTLVDACNFASQVSPRFGDSVARAHGRGRCVVEQYASREQDGAHYAAGYWELELGECRAQALRHTLLGARQFLFHAFGQSDGRATDAEVLTNPRFDFPPAINFEPWFADFPAVAREIAEVSAFIDSAIPIRRVALLYPLHTVWGDGPGAAHARLVGEWSKRLSETGIGFDLVDDRALAAAELVGEQLRIGAHSYRAVILAGASMLPAPSVLAALESLAGAGGTVLATAPLPDCTATGGDDSELARRLTSICKLPPVGSVPGTLPTCLTGLQPELTIADGGGRGTLWRWLGATETDIRVVLFNDSDDPRQLTLTPASASSGLSLTLEPQAVRCLCLPQPSPAWPCVAELVEDGSATQGSPATQLALSEHWTLQIEANDPVKIDPEVGWERQGFPTFSGEGVYRARFDLPAGFAGLRWVLELPEVHCVIDAVCNGAALGTRTHRPFRFSLESVLTRRHDNELVLRVRSSAANRYYATSGFQARPQPSGLAATPLLLGYLRRGGPG